MNQCMWGDCTNEVQEPDSLCKSCEVEIFGDIQTKNPQPRPRPAAPPRPTEPVYPLSNAELADAIEWARASLGKIPGNDSAVAARVKKHLFDLLDVQAMRAKVLNLPNQ